MKLRLLCTLALVFTAQVAFSQSGGIGSVSGTGSVCLTVSCIMTTPSLGTPSALTLTNATGLPIAGLAGGVAAGDIIYFNGTNWIRLAGNSGTTNCLQETSGGVPSWVACASGSGTVTSVGWTGGIVSIATSTTTPAFTIAGTSGGIVGFTASGAWASSAALPSGAVILGGGAGATPTANAALAANSSGQFTKINNLTTAGNGVGIVVAVSDLTGQAAAQSGTAITLLASTNAAMYRIDFYADTAAVCPTPGPGAVNFLFNWTDASNARSLTTGNLVYASSQSATAGAIFGVVLLWAASGNTITYTPTLTACTTGTATWDAHTRLSQL